MSHHLPQMGGLARPYSQIGLAGSSILSWCHHSDVSPAVFPLAFSDTNLYQVSPLEVTVAPEGIVRWWHHYTDPYAPTMDPNNASSTLMSSWIVPVSSSHGIQWYYHARFRGCGHDARHLVAALAGIIAIPHVDPASEPDADASATAFPTMIQWRRDPDLPRDELTLYGRDEALAESRPAVNDLSGHIGIWPVPYTADTGTKWGYHCRFRDTAGSGRVGMLIEGVVVVEYPAVGHLPTAQPDCRPPMSLFPSRRSRSQ